MEWIDQDFLAILPAYRGDFGNCTLIVREDGQFIVGRTLRTVIRKICQHHHIDLKSANSYYGQMLSQRTGIPLAVSPERIYIQLKTREPVGKDDGAMGYFRLSSIKDVSENNGAALVRLQNMTDIACLCTAENVKKQISNGKLVRELYGGLQSEIVRESLEYYHNKDGPAMKSDIARLYMKLDDLLLKLKTVT